MLEVVLSQNAKEEKVNQNWRVREEQIEKGKKWKSWDQ
jgi:hypothetical protein